MILSNGGFPTITIPTRLTPTTSTIIDHIVTNDIKHRIEPFVMKDDLTDHYPIGCCIKIEPRTPSKKLKTISFYRDNSKFNKKNSAQT